MSTHDFDIADIPAQRSTVERSRDSDAAMAGVRERRLDVLGTAGLLRLQRSAGNAAVTGLAEERSPVLDVISSGGAPLEGGLRTDMESRIGADFGDVRVHTGANAHASAQSVNARAYTVGSNVVFQRDAWDPSSVTGRTTLAHELTHVVQQRSGPVDGTPTRGGVSVSDPGDRFERAASENAERVMAAPVPGSPVQRDAAPEEEEEPEAPVQGSFLQRQEEEDEAAE